MFEEFDETSGRLVYMGHDQAYIAAGLIALNEDEDLFVAPELPRPLKYSDATEAIARLISVSPVATRPSEIGNKKGESDGD